MSDRTQATLLLREVCDGDEDASDELLPLVYDELRRVAGAFLRGERRGHTLQATALVHEAYVRLIDVQAEAGPDPAARRHFIWLAARAMRQILVEHARQRGAAKRGGGLQRVTLPDSLPIVDTDHADILDLEEAINRLEIRSPRLARVAEMRLFGGLELSELAPMLGVSLTTVKGDWDLARALLGKLLSENGVGAR